MSRHPRSRYIGHVAVTPRTDGSNQHPGRDVIRGLVADGATLLLTTQSAILRSLRTLSVVRARSDEPHEVVVQIDMDNFPAV
jgi:hypothetical protein